MGSQKDSPSAGVEQAFARDGVIGKGLDYLQDYPALVFAVVLGVVLVTLAPFAGGNASVFLAIVGAIVILGVVALFVVGVPTRSGVTAKAGSVVDVRGIPKLPEGDEPASDDLIQAWLDAMLDALFNSVQVFIDRGARQRVAVGDVFELEYPPKAVRGARGERLGQLGAAGRMVRVARVEDKYCVAQVIDWPYQAFFDEIDKRSAGHHEEEVVSGEEFVDIFSPVRRGMRALRVPEAERAAYKAIKDLDDKTRDDDLPPDKRAAYSELVVDAAERFAHEYPNGALAPRVLFDRAYALLRLGRRGESRRAFETFLDRYPFHFSAGGAREHLDSLKRAPADDASGEPP